jgi:hypothetical protein
MATLSQDFQIVLLVLGVIGVLLLLLRSPQIQGFANLQGPRECGVDMPPCSVGQKCINGWCRKTNPIPVHDPSPVPLLSDNTDTLYAEVLNEH